jgi:hypothetical protein
VCEISADFINVKSVIIKRTCRKVKGFLRLKITTNKYPTLSVTLEKNHEIIISKHQD